MRPFIDGFLLAELVGQTASDAPTRLSEALRQARERRLPSNRAGREAFLRDVARRVRPTVSSDLFATLSPRARTLLGGSGPLPRKRFRPAPGLAATVRRTLGSRETERGPESCEAETHGRLAGRGRAVVASLESSDLLERTLGELGAEEAAAVMTLRSLLSDDDRPDVPAALQVRALRATAPRHFLAALGALMSTRAGRELTTLYESGCFEEERFEEEAERDVGDGPPGTLQGLREEDPCRE